MALRMMSVELERIDSAAAPLLDGATTGSLGVLILAGGEPFTRKDLPEIARAFYQNNKLESIYIMSNGQIQKRIFPDVTRVLQECPNLNVTVALGMGVLWRIAHAPFGRLLQALRDNEQRVRTLGYNTFRIKFEAFVIMGGVVGFAGALLAFMLRGAYADNLSWQHAGDPVMMTILGGIHHFLGPLWGSMIYIALRDQLSSYTEHWWLAFGRDSGRVRDHLRILVHTDADGVTRGITPLVRTEMGFGPARIPKLRSAGAVPGAY